MSEAKRCRHKHAIVTMFDRNQGYFWCPDCGATRKGRTLNPIYGTGTNVNPGAFVFAEDRWIYPRGKESVYQQLASVKKA